CGNDGVNDTPITKGFTSCALSNAQICSPGTEENVQNYMDYSYCSRMFTQGQAVRMQTCLNSATASRNNLSTAGNLAGTGITSPATNCIPQVAIAAIPSATVCSGNSLTVVSYTSNANPTSYSWTANNGATIANPAANNAVVTFNTPGQTTVICNAITASGSSSAQAVVTVLNAGSTATLPVSESFENGLPGTWSVVNPDAGVTWALTNAAASTGNNSYFIDGTVNPAGQYDYLQMETIDIVNNPNDTLTFKYAYARQNGTHADVFKVEGSKDCGGNWSTIFNPSAASMASGSGGTTSTPFVPTLSQWKHVNLTNYPGWTNFANFGLYPNPSKGEAIVKFNLHDAAHVKIDVIDLLGKKAIPSTELNLAPGEQSLSVNKNHSLSKGIYFVNLSINGAKMSKKLIID
ncbi:MAG: domain containing protein, partial [Bacteroidetes bacterium]|nr:domain containing protein [Bacteroidota bacterium]